VVKLVMQVCSKTPNVQKRDLCEYGECDSHKVKSLGVCVINLLVNVAR